MKFIVTNREQVRRIDPSVPHIVIQITDHSGEFPILPSNANRLAVLQVRFDDVDKDIYDQKCITFDQAQETVDFVLQYKDSVQLIIVHCNGGISRSAAVAAVLDKHLFNGDDIKYFEVFRPNAKVYSTLLKVVFEGEFSNVG